MNQTLTVISLAALLAVQAPAAPSQTGGTVRGEIGARVDHYLARLVPYGFSGAVLVAKDGVVVLEKAYGLANRETGQPYAPDMVSSVGSITKQFTAAAIMRLEVDGKLKVSDSISAHLPGVPEDKAAITIHHLLTHTAGFRGDLGGADTEPIDRDALVAKVLAAPLASKPGERFEYSNEGYSLAGAIVERVSGLGYEAYLREKLFLPAGMKETGYLLPAWPVERMPLGYGQDGQPWGRVYRNHWLPDGPGWYLRANGGLHSTLADLYRWHLALEAGKVLPPEAVSRLQEGHVASVGAERYGYGWGVEASRRGTRVVSHNGGNGFLFADFRRYPEEKVVIIAMTNQPSIPATQLAPRQIEALVFDDEAVVMPPEGVAVPLARREALAGRYGLGSGATVTIRVAGDALEAEADDPLLLGGFDRMTPPGGRFSVLEARSMSLLEAAAADDFRPMFEAFADDRPFAVVEANQRRFWNGWRRNLGDFERLELLGTAIQGGDPAVTVRARFAKGGPIVQLIWGPRRLAGFRVIPRILPVRLAAESPDAWCHYSYRAPALVRFTFGPGGSLALETASGTLEGRKR